MNGKNNKTTDTSDRELTVSRFRSLVWEVWTNTEYIYNWWGSNGFTNTIYKMEVKPGDVW